MSSPRSPHPARRSASFRWAVAAPSLLLLSGCWSVGERRPLFGGVRKGGAPPARARIQGSSVVGNAEILSLDGKPLEESPVDRLLTRLRNTKPGPERRGIALELVRRGRAARDRLDAARAEERVLIALLDDVALRGEAGPQKERTSPGPKGLGKRHSEAPWVQDKFRLALDRYAGGDLLGSLRVVDAILDLEPDCELSAELHALRRRCQDRLVESSLIVARIQTAERVLKRDQPLKIEIRFENVSDQPIVLHQDPESGLGVVHIDYEELLYDGTRTRIRTQHGVSLGSASLRIGPGQTRSIQVRLPAPHRRLPKRVVGRYELSGRLRPTRMAVGDSTTSRFLPVPAIRLVVLDAKDRELAKDPRKSLAASVKKASKGTRLQRHEPSRQAFVAGILFAESDHEAALSALIAALNRARPPLSHALCAALARVNGEPLSFTRDEWLAWWTLRRARPSEGDRAAEEVRENEREQSTDEAPKDEAPTDEAPKDEAPKDEAPKDEAPKDEAPKDEAPKGEVPKGEAQDSKTSRAPVTPRALARSAEWKRAAGLKRAGLAALRASAKLQREGSEDAAVEEKKAAIRTLLQAIDLMNAVLASKRDPDGALPLQLEGCEEDLSDLVGVLAKAQRDLR